MKKPDGAVERELYLYRYDPRRYKFAEYEVDLIRHWRGYRFMMAFEKGNWKHYWTRIPVDEGKPGMHCVWFTERKPNDAIQILSEFEQVAIKDKDEKIIRMCCAYKGQEKREWKGNRYGGNQ